MTLCLFFFGRSGFVERGSGVSSTGGRSFPQISQLNASKRVFRKVHLGQFHVFEMVVAGAWASWGKESSLSVVFCHPLEVLVDTAGSILGKSACTGGGAGVGACANIGGKSVRFRTSRGPIFASRKIDNST